MAIPYPSCIYLVPCSMVPIPTPISRSRYYPFHDLLRIISLTELQFIDTVSPEYSCIEGFISVSCIVRTIALVLAMVALSAALASYISHLFSVFTAHYECRKYCF